MKKKAFLSLVRITLGTPFYKRESAAENLIKDGDFEKYCTTSLQIGNACVLKNVDWTVSGDGWSGFVKLVDSTAWLPKNGQYSLELNKADGFFTGPYTISQQVTTAVGTNYQVSFYLNKNWYCGPSNKTGFVSAQGISTIHFSHNTDQSGWIPITYNFTAYSVATVIQIGSTTAQGCGPVIDMVQLISLESPPTDPTTTLLPTTTTVPTENTTSPSPTSNSTSSTPTSTPTSNCLPQFNNFCQAFRDDFDTLDTRIWKNEVSLYGSSDWEFQAYTKNPKNTFVENGILYLKPTRTTDTLGIQNAQLLEGGNFDWNLGAECTRNERTPAEGCDPANGNYASCIYPCRRNSRDATLPPVMSSMLITKSTVSMKYGKLEVRAKLPKGDWIWPAIWLLPKDEKYGTWPLSGEIDIMESRGNPPDANTPGYDQFGSTLHWGNDYREDGRTYVFTHNDSSSNNFADAFHTYGMKWTPEAIVTYLDTEDNVIMSVPTAQFASQYTQMAGITNPWVNTCPNAPFDQEFYIIFNVAVGGVAGYFPDSMPNKPWKNQDNAVFDRFWNAEGQWYQTWDSAGNADALAIDWINLENAC